MIQVPSGVQRILVGLLCFSLLPVHVARPVFAAPLAQTTHKTDQQFVNSVADMTTPVEEKAQSPLSALTAFAAFPSGVQQTDSPFLPWQQTAATLIHITEAGFDPPTAAVFGPTDVTWINDTATTHTLRSGEPGQTGPTQIFLPLIQRGSRAAVEAAALYLPYLYQQATSADFSATLAPGQSFTYRFTAPETYKFHLATAPTIKGELTLSGVALLSASPSNGEGEVAVTRETVLEFSGALDPASVTTAAFSVQAGSPTLEYRLHLSADKTRVTLFYKAALPGSTRVRVSLNANQLKDALGNLVDLDGDGAAGGAARLEFDTLSLTVIPGTVVCGRVFASELAVTASNVSVNTPLKDVTVSVDGLEEGLNTKTDGKGNFCLNPAPAGRFFVHVDGRTATNNIPAGQYYPFVGKAWQSVPGQQTSVGEVYLPLVPANTLQPVSAAQDTQITFPDAVLQAHPDLNGVSILVPADSLFSDDGARGGKVGIAPVPPDRLPGGLPPDLNFPVVITVQTDGASNFDKPAPVCFPNLPDKVTNQPLPVGSKSALWSFNHDTGHFEIVGPMTVSTDGKVVCTDPGVGILAPGWHGTQPGTTLTARIEVTVSDKDISDDSQPLPTPNSPKCDPQDGSYSTESNGKKGASPQEKSDMLHAIKTAIDNSPNNMAIVGQSDSGFSGAGDLPTPSLYSGFNRENTHDHVALIYKEGNNYIVKEMLIGKEPLGPLGSSNPPQRSLEEFAQGGTTVTAVPVNMSNEQATSFKEHTNELIHEGAKYSFGYGQGHTCASALGTAAVQSGVVNPHLIPPVISPGVNTVTPQNIIDTFSDLNKSNPNHCSQNTNNIASVSRADSSQLQPITGVELHTDAVPPEHSYYIVVKPENNSVLLRGEIDAQGQFTSVLPPNDHFYLLFYAPLNKSLLGTLIKTGSSGSVLEPLAFKLEKSKAESDTDDDKDSLTNIGEFVIGTDPAKPDTDGDGLSDGAEVEQGTNPLDGMPAQTGIIATVDTPGTAVDVCAVNENTIAVADSAAGVAIFNVFNGMNPRIIAQVDTPGTAQAIACAANRVMVADGTAGLAIVDITNLSAPILQRLDLGGTVQAITSKGSIAYAGISAGKLFTIDSATGAILSSITLSGNVHDIALAGDELYVLTNSALFVYNIAGTELQELGSILVSGSPAPLEVGRKLFVGGGLAYVGYFTGYSIIDVNNPSAMQLLGSPATTQAAVHDIAVNGTGLLLATTSFAGPQSLAVSLYDTSNPIDVTRFLTSFETPGDSRALTVNNGLAYLADSGAGLQVINYLAYDNKGVPPTIRLTTNFAPGVAEEGAEMRVSAVISDDVQVRNVEFYVDGQRINLDGNFPFETRFTTPRRTAQPSFKLRARAIDTGGNVGWSDDQTITLVADATPPRVQTVAPAAGSLLGLSQATQVSATFSEPINPASLTVNSFQVFTAGADGVLGNGDDTAVANGALAYDGATNTATVTFATPLTPQHYRAVLATSVTDTIGNPLATAYAWTFQVVPVIQIGDTVNDLIGTADEQDIYRFSATAGQRIYFDEKNVVSCIAPLRWKITDEAGTLVFDEKLGISGCGEADAGLRTLPKSNVYEISVFSAQGLTGTYQFQLWDVPAPDQFEIKLDDTVANGIPNPGAGNIESPGREDIYLFTVQAGQQVYFDELNVVSCLSPINWRLFDPNNATVFNEHIGISGCGEKDAGLRTLNQSGTYRLVVSANEGATGVYQFKLWNVPPPQQFSINIGDTVSDGVPTPGAGNIESPGREDIYLFTAQAGQQVYFDELNIVSCLSAINWRLFDPNNGVVFDEHLGVSGCGEKDAGLRTLNQSGTYRLVVSTNEGATGVYQFKLWNGQPTQ